MSTIVSAAFSNSFLRFTCVATIVPLPGNASPRASFKQFMELAVNIPEHEPHVGQAFFSISYTSSSDTLSSAATTIASTRSRARPRAFPASMGPPETNTVGMLSRIDAISIPGVILSQLLMQIMASALCAFTTYSTLSAMMSRDGSE